MSTPTRFIFGGGGTGGHLYPGLAIWREIQSLDPSATALFLCSAKPLDAELLKTAGLQVRRLSEPTLPNDPRIPATFTAIPAKAFGIRPVALWRFLKGWGPSIRLARAAVQRARSEGTRPIVVAMGGYVAAPVVQAARAEKTPRVLVNLDAVPGKANTWIARHADLRLTAADSSMVPAAWERLPPIVRRGAARAGSPEQARVALGLAPDRPTLVVTGGSQGAGSLNNFVTAFAERHAGPLREGRWQVLHQTGKGEVEQCQSAYARAGVDSVVVPFITDMASAWGAATLAVARCGANTVAELWSNRVPALLLPYPYHKDEHQKFNAEPLERCGGALVCKDHIDPAKNLSEHVNDLLRLVQDPRRLDAMRAALQSLGPTDGAARVAKRLLDLAKSAR
ncbi:MAG: UDP-N-acetylglucosamine--N-acetylmuramyl-(pentapeptide) pyrophosphoryl-undecaprenol N-acetylglucosamine transferase [Phycisphaerales bacterium]